MIAAMLRMLLIPTLFIITATTSKNLIDDLLKETAAPTLRRVVVLARHGSKVPEPHWVLDACPAFRKTQDEFLSKLQTTPNELTAAGQRLLYSAGQFARQRYIDNLKVLPKSYYLNGTFSFQSQRSPFCLQSTAAFCMGMFPDGTGPPGFLPSNPQIVPISVPYGQQGTDVLFNCRDGPCAKVWERGKKQMEDEKHLNAFKGKYNGILAAISKACDAKPTWEKRSDVLDDAKDLDDAITWAKESGLSVDFYGDMSKNARAGFEQMAYEVVKKVYVGHGEQLAVTACGFPSRLLDLLSNPGKHVQFDFFLNHREMLYGTLAAFFFDQTFEIPNHFPGFMITGSTFFFELHEDSEGEFVKVYLYFPAGNGFVVQLLPQAAWKTTNGYMAQGSGDLFTDVMTVEDAKRKCDERTDCQGFCHSGPPTPEPVAVYFKSKVEISKNDQQTGQWTSYFKTTEKGCTASRCPLQSMKDAYALFRKDNDVNGELTTGCLAPKTRATPTIDLAESEASSNPIGIAFTLIAFIGGVVIGRTNIVTLWKRKDVTSPLAPRDIQDRTAEQPLLQSAL